MTAPSAGGRIVVAGGTGALGGVLVERLIADGARVAVPYRGATGFDRLRARIGTGDRLWGAAADIATIDGARTFIEAAAAAMGGLDGLAVVAGAYAGGHPLAAAPEDEWRAMMESNLDTAHALCRAAIPRMAERGGSVVLVASRLVDEGGAGSAAYTVSKAAVAALSRVLALENRALGIRFNCVAPGTIDTPDNRKAMPDADRTTWTSPESIARVIAFLLSPASAPVSGAYVPVDGR